MITTILFIAFSVLHAASMALHAIQKRTNSQVAGKLADGADTAAAAVEAVEKTLEPETNTAAGVKTVLSLVAVWIIGAALLATAVTSEAGCAAGTRDTIIVDSFAVANAVSAQLETFSRAREQSIIAGARDLADGRAQLAAWRAKVDIAEKALDAVYRAIATAKLLETEQSLASLLTAAAALKQELRDLGVTP